jgi:hypothetical protein
MKHRVLRYMTAALAVALAVLGVQGIAQQRDRSQGKQQNLQTPAGAHTAHSEALDHCAKVCNDCQRSCDACATHCAHLVAQGKNEHLRTLQTCQDCATLCVAAAQIVARQGPFTDLVCRSCAEACARCGKACEEHSSDKMMKSCAEECRRCEQACREMLQHIGYSPEKRGR